MAEENQNQPKTLEELAGYFDRITGIYGHLDRYNNLVKSGGDPKQRAGVMQGLAGVIVGQDAEHVDYQNELRQYIHPEAVNVRASEAISTAAKGIGSDYKARLDEIIKSITEKLNANLKGVKDKPQALEKIAYAFYPALRSAGALRTLSKEDANNSAALRLRGRSGASTTFVDPTSEPGYEQSLQYRLIANEFLNEKEDKEGEKTYSINEGKLKNLIKENILIGSILYNAQSAEEAESEEVAYRQAA